MGEFNIFYGTIIPVKEFILKQVEKKYGNRLEESLIKYSNRIWTKSTFITCNEKLMFTNTHIIDLISTIFYRENPEGTDEDNFRFKIDDNNELLIFGYVVPFYYKEKLKTEKDILEHFEKNNLNNVIKFYCLEDCLFELYKFKTDNFRNDIMEIYKNRQKL